MSSKPKIGILMDLYFSKSGEKSSRISGEYRIYIFISECSSWIFFVTPPYYSQPDQPPDTEILKGFSFVAAVRCRVFHHMFLFQTWQVVRRVGGDDGGHHVGFTSAFQ